MLLWQLQYSFWSELQGLSRDYNKKVLFTISEKYSFGYFQNKY